MASENKTYLPTQIGDLGLVIEGDKLLSLSIDESKTRADKNNDFNGVSVEEKTTNVVLKQLEDYFSNVTGFRDLALTPRGTRFQKAVWRELSKIPMGETRTYGQIAKKLNSSARAVGNACRKNPIAIIIPCHRVVSAQGIGGYAGKTEGKQLNIKRWLLNHEGANI